MLSRMLLMFNQGLTAPCFYIQVIDNKDQTTIDYGLSTMDYQLNTRCSLKKMKQEQEGDGANTGVLLQVIAE